MENLQRGIVKQTRATADLLTTAEILGLIPISYYSGNILFHSHAELQLAHPAWRWIPSTELHSYEFGLIPGVIAIFLSRLIRLAASDPAKRLLRRFMRGEMFG